MSQEKVNKYKEEKVNRKKNMKKEKMERLVRRTVAALVGIVIIGWIGYSADDIYETNRPKQTAEINYDAIDNYQQGLDSEAE